MHTPVLFLVFNRPDTTAQVFEAIREARPPRLYVAADGPRKDRPGEKERCRQVREIASAVDWPCELKTLFRDDNLGCGIAVSTAIDWFFENEPEGIILEDDCLPEHSFFLFCQTLLATFRTDERIMLISGHNVQGSWKQDECDYFFSHLGGIWGWASWARAWAKYDKEMPLLHVATNDKSLQHLLGTKLGKHREAQLYSVVHKNTDTWDFQWGFARHINSGMAVVPSNNLITNIGFGAEATHTHIAPPTTVPSSEIAFPIRANPIVVADAEYDALFFRLPTLLKRGLARIQRTLISLRNA